jgi:hypothetical protein
LCNFSQTFSSTPAEFPAGVVVYIFAANWSRSTKDSMGVSETLDPGSIPGGTTDYYSTFAIVQMACGLSRSNNNKTQTL